MTDGTGLSTKSIKLYINNAQKQHPAAHRKDFASRHRKTLNNVLWQHFFKGVVGVARAKEAVSRLPRSEYVLLPSVCYTKFQVNSVKSMLFDLVRGEQAVRRERVWDTLLMSGSITTDLAALR